MADRSLDRYDPLAGRKRSLAEAMDELTQDAALGIPSDGVIALDGVQMTPKGLRITRALKQAEWWNLLGVLWNLHGSAQWLIGDALVYGDAEYGETYEDVARFTGYEYQTLANCAWVAKQVKFSVRTEKLSFTHHSRVAAKPEHLQQMWLTVADYYQLTDAQFRALIRQAPADEGEQQRHLEALATNKPARAALLALIEGKKGEPPKGVAKLEHNALRDRHYARRLAGKPEARQALIGFATEQEVYWRQFREALEKGE